MGYAVGIDLGTTYSCVGLWINDRVEIMTNEFDYRTTPSVVSFSTEDGHLVGQSAVNQAASNPTNTIFDSKRLIGRRFSEQIVQNDIKMWPFKVIAGDDDKPLISVTCEYGLTRNIPPEQISSMVIKKLKSLVEDYVSHGVEDAVITVPAYFNQSQRQATLDAGKLAGLNVLRLLNEPTAAAIAYGLDRNITEKRNVLVFDLGGGTFDVSCLTIENDRIEVQAVGGDSHLGGQDFVNRMMQHFVELIQKNHKKDIRGDPKAMRKLREACEVGKRTLSSTDSDKGTPIFAESLWKELTLSGEYKSVDFKERLMRSKFEELNSDLFTKCIKGVEECLKDAKVDKKDIKEVVLIGGSSRIPKIQQMLREFMNGKQLCKSISVDEAVAYGATVQAALLSGRGSGKIEKLQLVDVTPLSLGIEIRGKLMLVFIPKNTPIPTRAVKELTTAHDYQTSIKIPLFEGERIRTEDNKLLGELKLTGIKPALRRVPKIHVCFDLKADGILDVYARDKNTGQEMSITIKYVIGSYGEEVQRMIKEAKEHRTSDDLYKRKGIARYSLEMYISQVRNEMMAMYMNDGEKRKVENAIREAVNLLDSRELAEVDEYEEERRKLMSVINVARRMKN